MVDYQGTYMIHLHTNIYNARRQ